MSKAWKTWMEYVEWRREKKKIVTRWMQPLLVSCHFQMNSCLHLFVSCVKCYAVSALLFSFLQAKAFVGWADNVAWRKRMRVITDRAMRRMMNARIAAAFYAWLVCGRFLAQLVAGGHLSGSCMLVAAGPNIPTSHEHLLDLWPR